MSACSTVTISRADAIAHIMAGLMKADNETIASIMYEMYGGERPRMESEFLLNNFIVVDRYSDDDFQPYRNPTIGASEGR